MTKKLLIRAILKFISGVILVGLLIFVPAGTLAFRNGWLLIGIMFIPMFFAGLVMMLKNPELLKKRLNFKENQKEQRTVIAFCAIMFVLGFVTAGLSYRFDIAILSQSVSMSASVIYIVSYLLYAEVLRENVYLSRTIEVQEKQKVIDTGLYRIVRHPMYGITILLFLSIPLVLGSVLSFIIFLAYPFIISIRIKNEEQLLEKELNGYKEYMKRVKYRLIPFIW